MLARLPLLLLLAFLPCLPASGQAKAGKQRTARFLFLGAPADAPQSLHLFDGSGCQLVELPRMNLSDTYPLPAGPLKLRLLAAPVASPEEVPAGAPAFSIPPAMTDVYCLVATDPANKLVPVRVQVVDAGADRFKNGQTLWFNLTTHQIAGIIGSQKINLKPRGSGRTAVPAKGRESYLVNLFYRTEGDERVYPICETNWLHDPGSRKLAFVFNEAGRRAPRVFAFIDHRPPKEQPAKP